MNKKNIQEAEVIEDKSLAVQETNALDKPQQDTEFAHASAKILKDIIRQNGWARKLGGQSEHIQYEGWQTLGKYYSYTVKTFDSEPIKIGTVDGFKAKAVVVNELTGVEVGSAEAYCMRDEANWRAKPTFQLASMAQTRAGSKALRQILGFVVALAGYSPTPAEEMTGDEFKQPKQEAKTYEGNATEGQVKFIKDLLYQKHYTERSLLQKYDVTNLKQLTFDQASLCINNLKNAPVAAKQTAQKETDDELVEAAIQAGL